MKCHLCNEDAVGRCYNCGGLFCVRHGDLNCSHCEEAIVAGHPGPDRISARPLTSTYRPGWWRPQVAENFEPPSCHECGGLARRNCGHCGLLYCPEHAGPGNLCAGCGRSARQGVFILVGVGLIMAALVLAGYFFHG